MKYKNLVSLIDKYQRELTKLQEMGMNYNRQLVLGDRIKNLKAQWVEETAKAEEVEDGICPSCGSELEPIYENNGFTEPEGPSKWEVSGYKPCVECNQRDDDQE